MALEDSMALNADGGQACGENIPPHAAFADGDDEARQGDVLRTGSHRLPA